jgi:hypothetical protein
LDRQRQYFPFASSGGRADDDQCPPVAAVGMREVVGRFRLVLGRPTRFYSTAFARFDGPRSRRGGTITSCVGPCRRGAGPPGQWRRSSRR